MQTVSAKQGVFYAKGTWEYLPKIQIINDNGSKRRNWRYMPKIIQPLLHSHNRGHLDVEDSQWTNAYNQLFHVKKIPSKILSNSLEK